jgi:hypothetical protein
MICKDESMVEKVNKALVVGWRGLSLRGYGIWLASNARQVRRTSAYRAWGLKHSRMNPSSNAGEQVVGGTRVCWVQYWWWRG